MIDEVVCIPKIRSCDFFPIISVWCLMSSFSACCCCFHWAFFRGRGLISGCPLKWCAHLTGKFTNSKARRKSCPDASRKNSFCYCWLQMPFFSIVCVCVCVHALHYLILFHFAENRPIKRWFCCLSVRFSGLDNEAAGDIHSEFGVKSSHIPSVFFFSLSLSHTHT